MSINYEDLSKDYEPEKFGVATSTLLIAEAPPPNKKDYFYLPRILPQYRNIRYARTLPHTIFYHYFRKIPSDVKEYEQMLKRLAKQGVFMIDICDKPVRISKRGSGIDKVNLKKYIIDNIPRLRDKIKHRGIRIPDNKIIFLDPGHGYKKYVVEASSEYKIIKWIDFRMSSG